MTATENLEATVFACGPVRRVTTLSLAGLAELVRVPDIAAAELAGSAFTRYVGCLALDDGPGCGGYEVARVLAPLLRSRVESPMFVGVGRSETGRPIGRPRAAVIARGLGATVLIAPGEPDAPPGDLLVPILEAYFVHGLVCFDPSDLDAISRPPSVGIQFRWRPGDEVTAPLPPALEDVLGDPTSTGLFVHVRAGEHGTFRAFDEMVTRIAARAAGGELVHAFVQNPAETSLEALVTVFFPAS